MNNFTVNTVETFNLSEHQVNSDHFKGRVLYFEKKYRDEFEGGSEDFLVSYKNNLTDPGNLDYDEWAFLCEQFMEERGQYWPPPGDFVNHQEKPEIISGFSFSGDTFCLIRTSISARLS